MASSEWWGYRVRYERTKHWIEGKGLEIGPGVNPQQVPSGAETEYFDKRTTEQLEALMGKGVPVLVRPMKDIPDRFPKGADYLIAHQVLEHTANPIQVLMQWHRYLRNGGRMIISVPDSRFAPGDKNRAETPIEHILMDYLWNRQDTDFESREHIFSFCHGWHKDGLIDYYKTFSAGDLTDHLLSESKRLEEHDLHWHASPPETWRKVIELAAWFAGRSTTFDAIVDATDQSEFAPEGEVIFIYRTLHKRGDRPQVLEDAEKKIRHALLQLTE
ncbi:MAG: class I SAM-dependent methyltransferase [Pseudomonadota bacterium]